MTAICKIVGLRSGIEVTLFTVKYKEILFYLCISIFCCFIVLLHYASLILFLTPLLFDSTPFSTSMFFFFSINNVLVYRMPLALFFCSYFLHMLLHRPQMMSHLRRMLCNLEETLWQLVMLCMAVPP